MPDDVEIRILGEPEQVRPQRHRPILQLPDRSQGQQQHELTVSEQIEWKLAAEIAVRFPRGNAGAEVRLDASNLRNNINLGDEIEAYVETIVPEQYRRGVREKLLALFIGGAAVPSWVHEFNLSLVLADPRLVEAFASDDPNGSSLEPPRRRTKAQQLARAILGVLLAWQITADVGMFSQRGPIDVALGRTDRGSELSDPEGETNLRTETLDDSSTEVVEVNEVNNHPFWRVVADLSAGGSGWRIGGDVSPRLMPAKDGEAPYVVQFADVSASDTSWFKFTSDIFGEFRFEARTSSEVFDRLTVTRNDEILVLLSGPDVSWQYYAIPVMPGDLITVQYSKDGSIVGGSDLAEIRNLSLVSPEAATAEAQQSFALEVSGPLSILEIGGDVMPTISPDVLYGSTHAVEFSKLGDNEQSFFSVLAEDSGMLSGWVYVSSEQDCDFLSVKVNDRLILAFSGDNHEWKLIEFPVEAGDEITFQYRKDPSQADGTDKALVTGLTLTVDETQMNSSAPIDSISDDAADDGSQNLPATTDSGIPADSPDVEQPLASVETDDTIAAVQATVSGSLIVTEFSGDATPQLVTLTEDGMSAIEFGGILENQSSSIFLRATGDGILSMVVKTDSEFKQDLFLILINGVVRDQISGQHMNWIDVKQVVSSGDEIELRFLNDESITVGVNKALVRDIELIPLRFTFSEGESQHTLILSATEGSALPHVQSVESFSDDAAYEFTGSLAQESSTLSLTAPITGTMTYIWKADTSTQTGELVVTINGQVMDGVRGNTTWQKVTMAVDEGDEIIFRYQVNETQEIEERSDTFENKDRTWVDSIEFDG